MSRSYCSYDEDWQRRKSVLIRSLFHDIPILSPVEEESNESSYHYVPSREVFASPQRPYSPLPPLIIERIPKANKHDEPEEYYRKLHKKIKRIYLKLFIEKRNLNSIDYDSNYNDTTASDDEVTDSDSDRSNENLDFKFLESDSPNNGNFDSVIEDSEARQSCASTKSNGYGADFESNDTEMIDVVNYTTSNEDLIMISEEEESDSDNIDEGEIRNEDSRSSENKESSKERIDDEEQEQNNSTSDDQDISESEESNERKVERSYDKEISNNGNIDEHGIIEETNQTGESDGLRIDDPEFSEEEISRHSTINDKVMTEESNETENEHESTKSNSDTNEKEVKSNESEGGNKLTASNVEPMEGDVVSSNSSEGPDYRQITTAALVHFDGSEDAGERESRVYEDSVKSDILPTKYRRVVIRRNVDVDDRIEVLTVLDENAGPKTVPTIDTDETETTDEDFEEAGTPQADAGDENFETAQPDTTIDNVSKERSQQDTDEYIENRETPELDALKEDVETMRAHQPVASDEDSKEMSTHKPESTEEDVEEMGTPRLDAFEEDVGEMCPLRLEVCDEDIEEMRTLQPDPSEEDALEKRTIHPNPTDEEMRTSQADTTQEEIELMRTPRPDLSHGTIPITHRNTSVTTSEHTAFPQELTGLTSSSQNGAGNNISEIQTSNDINEVLTSIFNESRNKDEAPITGRKRKLVDKSVQAVQTSRVTWDDIRTNFFVGTPKIFRLCACSDHICY